MSGRCLAYGRLPKPCALPGNKDAAWCDSKKGFAERAKLLIATIKNQTLEAQQLSCTAAPSHGPGSVTLLLSDTYLS